MAHLPKLPKGSKRVVYVDLNEELDEAEEEIDLNFWLPREASLTALCRGDCNVASDAACEHPGVINNALCTQRAHGALNTSLCSVDAVNDITRQWPASEPYALANPSGSDVNPRYRKRQQYKEPHNYAKLLLQSEKALENLSRKIRTEIQHSEMLELALEAERAANAGVLSFSAKPSTFGLDSLPSRDSQNHPVPRPRTYSEGNKPFITPHIPAYKELKRFELRNVSEVFPPWKALHSHMRTHLFRRRVPVDYLTFCEGEFKKAPTSSVNPLDLSARDLAQNSLQFLENLADTTMSRIKKYPIIAQRASCQASCSDEPSEEKFHDSQSSTSKSTAFGPELSSRLPQKSTIRGHPLDVVPGVFRPDSIESEPPTIDGEPPKHAPTMLGGKQTVPLP
jgi:hypothetical protein